MSVEGECGAIRQTTRVWASIAPQSEGGAETGAEEGQKAQSLCGPGAEERENQHRRFWHRERKHTPLGWHTPQDLILGGTTELDRHHI